MRRGTWAGPSPCTSRPSPTGSGSSAQDHPDTLACRSNLAGAYQAAGDLGRAIPLFEQTLADYVRVLGTDHPAPWPPAAASLRLPVAGDLGRAIPLFEQTLTDLRAGPRRRTTPTPGLPQQPRRRLPGRGGPGPGHPAVRADPRRSTCGSSAPTTPNPGLPRRPRRAYQAAGDLGRAIPLYEQTLTDYVRVLGPDHPRPWAPAAPRRAYHAAGDLGRAIPLYQQTLTDPGGSSARTTPTPWPPAAASPAPTIGGGPGPGHPPVRADPRRPRRVLGEDHPDTLAARGNLAYAYQAAGDLGRAIPLYEQTLADYVRVLGTDHPEHPGLPRQPRLRLPSAGDLGRAIPCTSRPSPTSAGPRHGPPRHPGLPRQPRLRLPSAGDLGRAIPLYQQTLADSLRVLGEDHPDTLASRGNLAYAYHRRGTWAGPSPCTSRPSPTPAGPRRGPPRHPGRPRQPRLRLHIGGGPGPGHPPVRADPHRERAGPRRGPPSDPDRAWHPRRGAPATSVVPCTVSVPPSDGSPARAEPRHRSGNGPSVK